MTTGKPDVRWVPVIPDHFTFWGDFEDFAFDYYRRNGGDKRQSLSLDFLSPLIFLLPAVLAAALTSFDVHYAVRLA